MRFQGRQKFIPFWVSPDLLRLCTRAVTLFSTILISLALQGCITPKRLPAVPDPLTTTAIIPGIPNARFWVHSRQGIDQMIEFTLEMRNRWKRDFSRLGASHDLLPPLNFLAISGGGDRGAFSAGLLVGWTEAGDRPDFAVVTGISTGALLAPFAFVGPEYDQTVKTIYTNIEQGDIFKNSLFCGEHLCTF